MEYIQLNKESGSTTRINFNNGVPYISYRILDDIPWLKNAVSTRLGGVSKDYLASMNLGFNRKISWHVLARQFVRNVMK